jgi:hypothetical protein
MGLLLFPECRQLWSETDEFIAPMKQVGKDREGKPIYDLAGPPVRRRPRRWMPEPATDDEAQDETTEDEATTPNQTANASTKTTGTGPRRSGNGTADKKAELIAAIQASPFWPKDFADQERVARLWLRSKTLKIARKSDLMRLSLDQLQTILDKLGERQQEDEANASWPTDKDAPPERGRRAEQTSLPAT